MERINTAIRETIPTEGGYTEASEYAPDGFINAPEKFDEIPDSVRKIARLVG